MLSDKTFLNSATRPFIFLFTSYVQRITQYVFKVNKVFIVDKNHLTNVTKKRIVGNIENKTKGDENMMARKNYTAEQLNDAEKFAKIITSVPEDKRVFLVMMANAFMAGMEVREAVCNARE